MGDLFRRSWHVFVIAFVVIAFVLVAPLAVPQTNSAPSEPATLVFVQKTAAAARLTSRELFPHVVSDLDEYLKANEITHVIRTDESASGVALPFEAVQEMTRNSEVVYLLYVVVDRPTIKWLKLTVECYDASGRRIWSEESSTGKELTRHSGEQNALKQFGKKLAQRLGQPGLSKTAVAQKEPATTTTAGAIPNSEPKLKPTSAAPTITAAESKPTIRLANRTPVHLFLAETLSSKTAKAGDSVKLQVLGDVKVGNRIVIANRAPAVGSVETVQSAGRAWRAGRLIIRLDTVTLVNQKEQPLEAWNASKGADTGAGIEWTNAVLQSYGLALFALPFAPLQHGNQALLFKGTPLEALTIGDTDLLTADIEAAQPKPPEPLNGPAQVTVYYPDFGHGSSVDIWCGRLKVGRLKRGGKLTLTLVPGHYWFRLGYNNRDAMMLDVGNGAEEYISIGVIRALGAQFEISWPAQLSVVPHDIGEAQALDTTTTKSQHVLTADKLDLLQLQADPHKKGK